MSISGKGNPNLPYPHGEGCGPGKTPERCGMGHLLPGQTGNRAGSNLWSVFRDAHRLEGEAAFLRIVKLSEDEDVKDADRRVYLAANVYVVNRIYGKPTEHHEIRGGENLPEIDRSTADRMAVLYLQSRGLLPALPASTKEEIPS